MRALTGRYLRLGPDGAALAAGGATVLGFAPFNLFAAPCFSLAVLFVVVESSTTGRAAVRGWLFGLGLFGLGNAWVVESFQFNHIALPVAVGLTALMVALLALFPAVAAAITRWPVRPRCRPGALSLVLPAAWVLVELLRGWLFTGFTWLQLGYSQVDAPLGAWAPVAGSYGVGWAVACTAGVIACAMRRAWGWAAAGPPLCWGFGSARWCWRTGPGPSPRGNRWEWLRCRATCRRRSSGTRSSAHPPSSDTRG